MSFIKQDKFLAYVRTFGWWRKISACRRQACESKGVQTRVAQQGNADVEPIDALIWASRLAALRDALPTLPGDLAAAVKAHYFDGLTYKDAALRLKISATEVWNRCQDALGLLGLKIATAR